MFKFNRWETIWVLVLATFVSISASSYWLFPLIDSSTSSSDFVPVRYHPKSFSDDYFYFTKSRDYIDRNFLSTDSITGESSGLTPHASYSLSLLLGALGGMFDGSTETAYRFNYFVWPFLCFIFLSLYIRNFSGGIFVSSSLAFLAISIAPDMFRFPNILVTSLPLIIFFWFLSKKACFFKDNRTIAILSLLVGTSLLFSVPNFLVSCFCLFVFFVLELRQGNKKLLLFCLLTLLFSIPGGFVVLSSLRNSAEWYDLAIPPLSMYSGFHADWFKRDIVLWFLPSLALLALPFSLHKKEFLRNVTIGLLVGYLLVSFLHSSYLARYFIHRGGDLFFITLPFILLIGYLTSFLSKINVSGKAYMKGIPGCLILALLLFSFHNYSKIVKKNYDKSLSARDQDLKQLYLAINEISAPGENALSLDPDLHLTLNIYTPVNLYLPWGQGSAIVTEERLFRYFDLLTLYGADSAFMHQSLMNLVPHYSLNKGSSEEEVRLALWQLILFYGKYSKESPTLADSTYFDELIKNYKFQNRLLDIGKFKYIIISRYDLMNPSKFLKLSNPIFVNKTYKVFKI